MKRMSPPIGVQASPTATPGSSVRSATSEKKRSGPSSSRTFVTVRCDRARCLPSVIARATLRQTRADLALEVPQAGFARVARMIWITASSVKRELLRR